MDMWAKFPDFHSRFRAHVRQAIALDMIKIGWNGTSAAKVTDIATYPMMDDVNIGWLRWFVVTMPPMYLRMVIKRSVKFISAQAVIMKTLIKPYMIFCKLSQPISALV